MDGRSSEGLNMNLEGSRGFFENCRGPGELDLKFGANRGVYVKDGRAMD
jgi:hypothetical protein